jgi:hypothetical protein
MDEETIQPKLADDIVLKEGVGQTDTDLNLTVPLEFSASVDSAVKQKRQEEEPFYNNPNHYSIPAEHGVFVCICSALICLILAATTALACFSNYYTWPWQMDWPAVEGRLNSITPHPKTARFDYSYNIDGQWYFSGETRSGTFQHTLKVGQKITVRHHPKYLSLSAMEAGFNIVETPLLIVVTLGLIFAAWMFGSMRLIEQKPNSSSVTEPSQRHQ